jgi:hypothetical protein
VGLGLPEIADRQPPGPEKPVADQARRGGRLHLRQRQKLLRVFQRPLGISPRPVHHPNAVEDREVKRLSGCRGGGDEPARSFE